MLNLLRLLTKLINLLSIVTNKSVPEHISFVKEEYLIGRVFISTTLLEGIAGITVDSVFQRNYPVIQATTILIAMGVKAFKVDNLQPPMLQYKGNMQEPFSLMLI